MMDGMKQTGIRWIGEVPQEWTLIKMKHFSYMKGRIGWQGLTADEFIDEGPYLITGTDFENGKVCWDRCYHISEKRYNEAVPIQVHVGDVLVTKDGTIGKLAYIDSLPDKASLNSHLLVIRPIGEKYINRFLYWVLYSSVFQGYYEFESYGSTMDSLSQEKIGDFSFFAPPVKEQKKIADYLDVECAKLDSIIETLTQQIRVLRLYKKRIILDAVTKGIDGENAKQVKMDYCNSVCESWEHTRVKYFCRMYSGDNLTSEEIDVEGDYPVYGGNGLRGFYSDYTNEGESVLIGRQGALCGNVHIVNGKFWATDHAIVTYPITNVDNRFLFYLFSAMDLNQYSMTAAQPGLAVYTIQNLDLYIPSIKAEQTKIANYLDIKCRTVDEVLMVKKQPLKTVQLHKESLIFEYVTGKKRVKEVI